MTDRSPEIDVSITIGGRIQAERLPELIEVIRQLSVVQLSLNATAGGEQLLISEPEDPTVVTLGQFRNHYLTHLEAGQPPSSLPTTVFYKVAKELPPEAVSRTKDGRAFAIKREAFDAFLEKSKVKGPITGKKTWSLLFGVARDLPQK